MKYTSFLVMLFFSFACHQNNGSNQSFNLKKVLLEEDPWSDYWYTGEGEISVYETQQFRYSDIHPGYAVLIQVTEDFLTDLQVKNDHYKNPNSISVLKTNLIRRFTTGIYDYSIMQSVFTPVDLRKRPKSLKANISVQDWCGQIFSQLNLRDKDYQIQQFSYFEAEADQEKSIDQVLLEDELFNLIRLNPDFLPTGKAELLPSLAFLRLKHLPYKAIEVEATLSPYEGKIFTGEGLVSYLVEMGNYERELEIVFKSNFPHQIEGWIDRYPNGSGKIQESISKLSHQYKGPYWERHDLSDQHLREKIGL